MSFEGQFDVPRNEQVLQIFNGIGYQPPITIVSSFKMGNIPRVWNSIFRIALRCFIGSNFGLDKATI